jgi:hypothetical protein
VGHTKVQVKFYRELDTLVVRLAGLGQAAVEQVVTLVQVELQDTATL